MTNITGTTGDRNWNAGYEPLLSAAIGEIEDGILTAMIADYVSRAETLSYQDPHCLSPEEVEAMDNMLNHLTALILSCQAELHRREMETLRQVAKQTAHHQHLFTLTFQDGSVAVLEVRGAINLEHAHAIAGTALKCSYRVADGDQTCGQADVFYLWSSSAAQECQPHHRLTRQAVA